MRLFRICSFCFIYLQCCFGGLDLNGQGLIVDPVAYNRAITTPSVSRAFTALPRVVSLKDYCPEPARQIIPACVGFSLAYAATIRRNIQMGVTNPAKKQENFFAPLFIYNQAVDSKEGCNKGTKFECAFDVAKEKGLDEFKYWSSRNCRDLPDAADLQRAYEHRITGEETIKSSDKQQLLLNIKAQLYNQNPILAGLCVDSLRFRNYKRTDGLVDFACEFGSNRETMLHAVTIIGYDDDADCFEAINSYGMSWGEGGFFRIRYGDFLNTLRVCYFIAGNKYRDIAGEEDFIMRKEENISITELGGGFDLSILHRGLQTPEMVTTPRRSLTEVETTEREHYSYSTGVRNGDTVQFIISVKQPGYIYLFNKGTSGEVSVLFPLNDDEYQYSAYFPYKGAATTFPHGDQYITVEGSTGTEYLYLLFSTYPLDVISFVQSLNNYPEQEKHFSNLKAAAGRIPVLERREIQLQPDKVDVSAQTGGDFIVPIIIAIPHY